MASVQIKVDADEEIKEDENSKTEMAGTEKVVWIGNNEVPLADMPFETDDNISWWWLLIIALLGATG